MTHRRIISLLFAVALGGSTLFLTLPAHAGRGDGPVLSVGDKAPGFFMKTINPEAAGIRRFVLGNVFDDEATQAVVISFFATWCAPCKKELPVLQQLWKGYGDRGLRIVVISIDKEKEAVESLGGFIKEFGLTFPVVSDRFNLLARRYLGTTTALPSLFITDGDGIIRSIHQSYDDDAAILLEKELAGLLGITLKASLIKTSDEEAETPKGETDTTAAVLPGKAEKKVKTRRKKAPKTKRTRKVARGS